MILEKERNHDEDIRIFIESQLRFEEDVDAELLRHIRAEILEKSSGIFLWVNLVVHQLNEVQRQDGRMKAVQQRLREIPEAAKQRLAPNGAMPLYDLFRDIIQKDGRNINKLIQITQIVFCARQPLHPKELYVLINQAYDDPFDSSEVSDKILTKHVLELSKGLAEVTKSEKPTVQFIHETVREFLRDGGLDSISIQSVDRDGHEILKTSCLKQIQASVSEHLELIAKYRDRGNYRNSKVHQVTRSCQRQFREQANVKFPFLEYASKNVLFHADKAESMGVSQREFLASFPIADWIPTYNLFQIYNTRRYSGKITPMLYILAEHGCDHLIKSSARFQGQYAEKVTQEVFSSALACAIYNSHLDTAWTLVGLDARSRPQNIVAPSRNNTKLAHTLLILLLFELGDICLMRKVLEDGHAMQDQVKPDIYFELVNSAEMIDLFLEVSTLPGFPSVGNHHKKLQADEEPSEPPRSNKNLTFIRRAIGVDPSLLTSEAWGGRMMFDYAISRDFQSLVSLYREYSDDFQSDLDAVLHHAAARGDLDTVIRAHRCGANLGSRDEHGDTALHLAARDYARIRIDHTDKVLQYLLSKEESCVDARDCKGRTALAITAEAAPGFDLSAIFQVFLEAGADSNILMRCRKCDKHDLPLVVYWALDGNAAHVGMAASDDRFNLNDRDSFGRTALSCCFAYQHGNKRPDYSVGYTHQRDAGAIGEQLLRQSGVDVNSRDDSGYTILEHFIRHAFPFRSDPDRGFQSFVHKFFKSDRLDPNLRTSNDKFPLELIVSLYNTWPAEFGDIDDPRPLKCPGQRGFNHHLIETLELLLGTGKVDIDVQRRCAGQAVPELKRIILCSIDSIS